MRTTKFWGIRNSVRGSGKISKFIFLLIPLFGFLSITLGVVSFYGQNTGDYSVRVDDFSGHSIRISEDPGFENSRTILRYPGIKFMNQASYAGIMAFHYDAAVNQNGYYLKNVLDKDREVVAFTFYVKNMNQTATINRINYKIVFEELNNHIEEHLRIMVVVDGVRDVYEHEPFRIDDVSSLRFKSDEVAVDSNIFELKAGAVSKVTVFIWIDGYLEEYLTSGIKKYTETDLINGSLKLNMLLGIQGE
ncbi:hypothetical protein [Acholeplasma granularum]|uniref:hypothetical protein n=1 Tax=Acholeplasma granularum TaxID=264635 RepID=UPI000470CD38|nr:hypothetical protein [Acholeplasma granularum]